MDHLIEIDHMTPENKIFRAVIRITEIASVSKIDGNSAIIDMCGGRVHWKIHVDDFERVRSAMARL